MKCKVINDIEVTVVGTISDDELSIYLNTAQAEQKNKIMKAEVTLDGKYIDVNYTFEHVPFENAAYCWLLGGNYRAMVR